MTKRAKGGQSGAAHHQWKGGITRDTAYGLFKTIQQRCSNPASKKYPSYGGAGIECRFRSFQEFITDIGSRPSRRHSVDRKDVLGHYEKGNVRWVTTGDQNVNKRKLVVSRGRLDVIAMLSAPLSFGG